jgi:ribosomal protein S18 acetylase RimI-like enzyme
MLISEKIVIRRAQVEDIHNLADLAVRTFCDVYAADNDPKIIEDYLQSSLTTMSLREEFDIASNIFLLAFCDGDEAPVGYAKLSTATEDPGITAQNTIEIERIYADTQFIGRGVGAALMRACLSTAEDLECDAIWLGVWERNERAILFYERWEFKTVGARQFAMGSELQDDLVMARQLN